MIQARTKGNQVQSDRADAGAASLAPILTRLRASGVTSLGALAAALTARNIPTLSGRGSWSAARVHRLVRRIARLEEGSSLPETPRCRKTARLPELLGKGERE